MNELATSWRRRLVPALALVASLSVARQSAAQDLPRVSVSRALRVAGLLMGPHAEDLLGLARVKFQGLIAAELGAVGYQVAEPDWGAKRGNAVASTLTLAGYVREEICDDESPSQCRIAILWELQDARGVAAYRTTTRAVSQAATLDKLRRELVEGALHSLLQRRRFALQLTDGSAAPEPVVEPLGFKQCKRPPLVLPQASRAVAASLVFIENGSSLTSGAIVSADGLILTNAGTLDERAPLRVRFSAEQALPANIVALDRAADVALLHVAAHTDTTCLPLREAPLDVGAATFGISSELSEDHAFSLARGAVQGESEVHGLRVLHIDPLLARGEGGPVLDEQGRVVGVVSTRPAAAQASAQAVDCMSALHALKLKPAAITDPRLVQGEGEPIPVVAYVRDQDDPPFELTRRYTYGTSATAHRVRTAGLVTASVGGVAIVGTWFSFRATRNPSPAQHERSVVLNDIGWTLLGLGAVGFGASFALPEGHDVVAVQSASRRHWFVAVGAASIQLAGQL